MSLRLHCLETRFCFTNISLSVSTFFFSYPFYSLYTSRESPFIEGGTPRKTGKSKANRTIEGQGNAPCGPVERPFWKRETRTRDRTRMHLTMVLWLDFKVCCLSPLLATSWSPSLRCCDPLGLRTAARAAPMIMRSVGAGATRGGTLRS